jgi:hypothetical protein
MANTSSSPVQYRVGFAQEILLKSSAATLDLVGFLLMLTVVGEAGTEVIGLTGDALYFIWFWFLGVNYMGGNSQSKIATALVNSIAESIPFVNGLYPGFSVQVWQLVKIMKKEDEENARKTARKVESTTVREIDRLRRAQEIRAQQQLQAANDNAEAESAAEAA